MKTEDLHPAIQYELTGLLSAAREHLGNGGETPPFLFSFEFEGEILVKRNVFRVTHLTRDKLSTELLRIFMEREVKRKEVSFVILLMEAWTAPMPVNAVEYILPENHPNKKEVILANVFTKMHQYLLIAPITRNPTHVGEFELRGTNAMEGPLVRDQEDTTKYH